MRDAVMELGGDGVGRRDTLMHSIGRTISDTDHHIRASVDRVLKARDAFEHVAALVKKSEAAYLQSRATLARLNGHDGSTPGARLNSGNGADRG
jgi:hypothetical protein